jgi:hypothetical protein
MRIDDGTYFVAEAHCERLGSGYEKWGFAEFGNDRGDAGRGDHRVRGRGEADG